MMNRKDGGARIEVGPHNTITVAMDDLPEAKKIALKKELEEEMVAARRRKLACFQKTRTGVIKKIILAITTTTTMAPMVTSNLTPKVFVKLVDVSVATKYATDLTQFTHIIADDMCNTLESLKTNLHNTLPRQVRLVVQQIQGEAKGKQPIGSPSTPYPGNTSAPGNMGTFYPGSTTAPGKTGVLANTSTSRSGSTLGNAIYVDASSPYPRSTTMGNLGFFPNGSIPYPGGASTSGSLGLPAHVTQPNPGVSPNFQQPYYQIMAYGPNIPPMGTCVPHGPILNVLFPRTPAYVTPNPRVNGEMNEGVMNQIARMLREFGFMPKGRSGSYQKLYPEYFDMIPYPQGIRVPDLAKFTGDDAKTTYEHVSHFLAQVNDVTFTDIHKIRMFLLSLMGTAFNWFTSLPLNSIDSWVHFEQKFHDYFYNGEVELRLSNLTSLR
jgi:hypothetical protein